MWRTVAAGVAAGVTEGVAVGVVVVARVAAGVVGGVVAGVAAGVVGGVGAGVAARVGAGGVTAALGLQMPPVHLAPLTQRSATAHEVFNISQMTHSLLEMQAPVHMLRWQGHLHIMARHLQFTQRYCHGHQRC